MRRDPVEAHFHALLVKRSLCSSVGLHRTSLIRWYVRVLELTFNVELVELVNGDLEVLVKVVEVQKEVWKRAR